MKTVFLVAGGTAGHVFPALALAEELRARHVRVEFFTDKRAEKYFHATDIVPEVVQSSSIPRAWLGRLKAAWKILSGMVHSLEMIREHAPSCVVGFGGYPSFPTMAAAQLLKIPTILHEQNAVFGRANRRLATRVSNIALSFSETKLLPDGVDAKTVVTGNPVRAAFSNAAGTYAPPGKKLHLLVFGGSQGSSLFSKVLPAALSRLAPELRARIVLQQQTRLEDIDTLTQLYAREKVSATILPFFNDIIQQYQSCHLVIGRAGASTVAELTAMGRPSILVPLAASLDGDQAQNAAHIVEHGAGWMMAEKDFTPDTLAARLQGILEHPAQLEQAAAAARALGRPDAARQLADVVMRYL